MEKSILKFVIEKAMTQICKNEDWNIEVVQTDKFRFHSPKEEEPYDTGWHDTTFRVGFPNSMHTIDIQFYKLEFYYGICWREVGISINIDAAENTFYRVSQLVATAPFMVQALKKALESNGKIMDRAMDKVLEKRAANKMEELHARIEADKAKIAARNPEHVKYYEPNHELECEEFVLKNIFLFSPSPKEE